MFYIECARCGKRELLREDYINVNNAGEPEDCMTQVIADRGNISVRNNSTGFTITCKACGNQIQEYDKPY